MGNRCLSAVRSEFESICDELSLAELFGNQDLWEAIQRIEDLLS
jgi:hypothetical protein